MLKILCIGDIVAHPGRETVTQVLPGLREELGVDLVIGNGENLAHGVGLTRKTMQEVLDAGVDVLTSGNHVWRKDEAFQLLQEKALPLLRPANMVASLLGQGWREVSVGTRQVLVLNLMGRTFFQQHYDDPFASLDRLLAEHPVDRYAAVILDFHAEATSDKVAIGWHVDGRISAVFGTHTHVPTADQRILPGGTAHISDVGMTGSTEGVIGVKREIILKKMLTQLPVAHEPVEDKPWVFRSVLVEVDPATRLATRIERVDRTVLE